jgi:NADH-quinone oxidoreductase subunit K
MITVPMNIQILVATMLFLVGFAGILVRRNILYMLMCIEIMLNSAGLVFVIAGAHWMQTDGQVMFIFILSVAAAEVAVALAIIMQLYRHYKTLQTEHYNKLKD